MIPRLAQWLVSVAVHRWPASRRETVAAEWSAELAAIGDEPGVGTLQRAVSQLGFGLSLACSRPHRPGESAAPIGWGRAVGRLVLLLTAPWFLTVVTGTLYSLGMLAVVSLAGWDVMVEPFTTAGAVHSLTTVLVTMVVAAALGGWAANLAPLLSADSRWLRARLAAVVVPTTLVVGMPLVLVLTGEPGAPFVPHVSVFIGLAVWWGLMTLFVGWAGGRPLRRPREIALTVGAGVIGIVGLSTYAAIAVAAWRHDRLWSIVAQGWPWVGGYDMTIAIDLPDGMALLARVLPGCTAFGLAYALRIILNPSPLMQTRSAAPIRPVRWQRSGTAWTGLLTYGLGLLVWAITLVVITPQTDFEPRYAGWVHGVRVGAVVLACCGLALLVTRGVPVLLAGLALLAVDVVVDRQDVSGVAVLALMLGLGTVVGAIAVWWSRIAGPRSDDHALVVVVRVVALVAAFVCPAVLASEDFPVLSDTATILVYATTTVTVAGLAGLAGACAMWGRGERSPVRIGLVAAVSTAAAGLLVTQIDLSWRVPWFVMLPFPLAVWLAALLWRERSRRVRVGAMVLGLVGAVPVGYFVAMAGYLGGTAWLHLAGHSTDGLVAMPGAVAIAVPLAMALTAPGRAVAPPPEQERVPVDAAPAPV